MTALLEAVRRYAEAHARPDGIAMTPIPSLFMVRAVAPSELMHAVLRPLVCLVVQGAKHVAMGSQRFGFSAGDSLLVSADVPTASRITRASVAAPYYSLVLELDPAVMADLSIEMKVASVADPAPVRIGQTDDEVADAALRLLRLIERPGSLPVLGAQSVREMHYWLLSGRHGSMMRRLSWPDGHAQRISRAVAVLRAEFAQVLRVGRLAEVAGMSPSSFHQHFRALTSLSPLQFQKRLRLIEARRLMLDEGASASHAAHCVGYESVPQFTREYHRLFGLPPVRETGLVRLMARSAA